MGEYREIFENLPDGVILHDADDGTIIDTNQKFCDMLGYRREELIELDFEALHIDEPPYTNERAMQYLRKAATDGPQQFEWIDETKTGERIPVEVSLRQTSIDGDQRVLAIVRDISERKKREHELEQYRTLINTIPDMAYVLDPDFQFTLVNDALVDTSGYTREELLESHASLLFTDEAIEVGEQNRERLRDGDHEVARLETNLKTASGEQIPCEVRGKPLPEKDGTPSLSTAGIIRDITEQKAREQKLEARSTAIEASIDGIAILDEHEKYSFVNEAHTNIYGYDEPDAFVGESWRMCYHEDELTRFDEEVMPKLFADGNWRGEAVGTRQDGSKFSQELSLSLTDDGRVICVVRDITERKRREQEVQRQNERLERFASVVSHDLRNPLNVADGRVELAQQECDSTHLDHATDALERTQALIDDLLIIAREGNRVRDIEPITLGEITKGCWRTVPTAQAELQVDTESTIQADRNALQQLLENLIRNAIEHGGKDTTVTVGDLDDGFYIADDGPGIPADERDRVFENGYSTVQEGTGFGLSIVGEVVSAHDWEIRATDSVNGGARFEITDVEYGSE